MIYEALAAEAIAGVIDQQLRNWDCAAGMLLPVVEDFAVLVAVRDATSDSGEVIYELLTPKRQSYHRTAGLLQASLDCFTEPCGE